MAIVERGSVLRMRLRASRLSSCLIVTAVVFFLNLQLVAARSTSIDNLGDALARQIVDARIHTLAITEFGTLEGAKSPRGKYLAGLLCESWLKHHAELVIVKNQTLAAQKLSLQDLKTPESLKQIGNALGIEAVVLGSLRDTADGFLLTVTVRTVVDGALVLTREQPLAHSQVLDSLAATDADTTASAPRAGVQGIGIPVCTYQPPPVFPDEARKAKVSFGATVLEAIITPEGRLTNIRVTRDPGYSFAERAVEALAQWRCKPARDKDKIPIAVTVPIEIIFRE